MSRYKLLLHLVASLTLFIPWTGTADAQDLLKRGGVDVAPGSDHGSSLDLTSGLAASPVTGEIHTTLALTSRHRVLKIGCGTLDATLSIGHLSDGPLPVEEACAAERTNRLCMFKDVPGPKNPGTFETEATFTPGTPIPPDSFSSATADQLDVGDSLFLTAGIEWTWCDDCWWPSLFVGTGFRRTAGGVSNVSQLGPYTVNDDIHPTFNLGWAVKKCLSERMAIRFEAKTLTTFFNDLQIGSPDGQWATIDGEVETLVTLSAGLQLTF